MRFLFFGGRDADVPESCRKSGGGRSESWLMFPRGQTPGPERTLRRGIGQIPPNS